MGSTGATPPLVIAGRLILLLIAGAGAVSAFALSRGSERDASSPAGAEAAASAPRYVCPMHPEIVSQKADQCPICRMALELVREAPASLTTKVVDAATRRSSVLPVRAPAWLVSKNRLAAVVYKEDLEGLSPREHALFFRATSRGVGIDVRLTAEPPSPQDRSTSTIYFSLEAGAPAVAAGDIGWVELAARPRTPLVVPVIALLPSAEGPYVLAAAEDGRTFSKRPVEIGKVEGGLAVVLSGLRDGEPIAVGSAFSLDAERRLREQREGTPKVKR